MRRNYSLFRIALLLVIGGAFCVVRTMAEPSPTAAPKPKTRLGGAGSYSSNAGSWQVNTVPKGKTYVVYNAKGKKVGEFTSGRNTNMTTDCVIIKCPFGSDVVCWKCMGFTAR
jgi:hypothetical protein